MTNNLKGKKKQTNTKIMHNAKALFEKKGLYNVTIEEISEASAICRSTFFNHFNSMEDLLISIANQEIEDLIEVEKSMPYKNSETVRKILHKLIDDTEPYPYLMMQLMMTLILKQEANSSLKKIWDNMTKYFDNEKLKPEYKASDCVSLLMGLYFSNVFHCFIDNKKIHGNEIKNFIDDTINLFLINKS